MIAGYAVNAHICYIYIRGEYLTEGKRLQEALDQALQKKFLRKKMHVDQDGILIFIFIMELELIYVEKKLLYWKVLRETRVNQD